jgi:cryptochrome
MVASPFKGGETEGLDRLKKKVSQQADFVNSFRKPKTFSTNDPADPLEPSTTGLSPYLSVGCLSVRRLWKEVEACNRGSEHTQPPESLHGQLLFREMFYLLSRSVPNWDQDFDNPMCKFIHWGEKDEKKLKAWTNGQTGFPFIDAMMRQLEATGWMHHLGRHAVSCFLTRGQLWQHWKTGRDLFERNLIDSDWALNNANWLWLSGVAPFSMPYFRLYNPCPDGKSSLNAETSTARFIKHWIPELKDFPAKYVYEPHLAPQSAQAEAKCIIGSDYPNPIVDRKEAAKQNLAKFKASLQA